MSDDLPTCDAPAEFIRFELPLVHMAKRIARREPIRIVAIGSSSTEGTGASVPAVTSYPSRLEVALKLRLPGLAITVVNSGRGGQEAGDELARFENDVEAKDPHLVIWQVGTNAVWKRYDLSEVDAAIQRGLQRLRRLATDVVLMDPQYAREVFSQPDAEDMVARIAAAAKAAGANWFRRFALMRHWQEDRQVPGYLLIHEEDGVHQTDWSYECVARALAVAINEAATRASPGA